MKGFGPIGERIERGLPPELPTISVAEAAEKAEAIRAQHLKRQEQAGMLSGQRVVSAVTEPVVTAEAPAELPPATEV